MTASLFERLGGEEAIIAAVDLFYEKVLADPLLRGFFGPLGADQLTQKQVAFMACAFGAPTEYRGRPLREAHAGLVARGLGDTHFNAVAMHLKATLEELSIEKPLIDEALAIVETTRTSVLGR